MSKVSAKTAALLAALIAVPSLVSCKHEAEVTGAQLSQLARDAGAEGVVDSVKEGYQQNVAPVVNGADQMMEAVQVYQEAKVLGNEATIKIREYGHAATLRVERVTRNMPSSEAELVSVIDEYNRDFVEWLKENFQKPGSARMERARDSVRSTSKTVRIKGRSKNS